uniref:Uncharacterized protein n=1 Tax=viral metagenome TaxID=1070528 RepID=A0A6C0HY27_9ZZZZ
MGFKKVDHVNMEYNKEYKIGDSFRGIYKGRQWTEYAYPRHGWGCHLEFENIRYLDKQLFVPIMVFSTSVSFSEFFSEKKAIQSCMEHRAVNLILRQIIGDDTFSWVGDESPTTPL